VSVVSRSHDTVAEALLAVAGMQVDLLGAEQDGSPGRGWAAAHRATGRGTSRAVCRRVCPRGRLRSDWRRRRSAPAHHRSAGRRGLEAWRTGRSCRRGEQRRDPRARAPRPGRGSRAASRSPMRGGSAEPRRARWRAFAGRVTQTARPGAPPRVRPRALGPKRRAAAGRPRAGGGSGVPNPPAPRARAGRPPAAGGPSGRARTRRSPRPRDGKEASLLCPGV
jgi:hypothetical protein